MKNKTPRKALAEKKARYKKQERFEGRRHESRESKKYEASEKESY